ncbi:MAG: right-handed parallel beta-helix repeat-containing protein [bacterium]
MRHLIAVLTLLASAPLCLAATIHVPADQPTIQAGIDAAIDGDTVLVHPGTYVENIYFEGKRILVLGRYGADSTTIQAADSELPAVSLDLGEPKGTTLSGFTITGCETAAVRCEYSSPTITQNIVTGNTNFGPGGTGISLSATNGSLIEGNIIHGNWTEEFGAAIIAEAGIDDSICHNVIHDNGGVSDIQINGWPTDVKVFNNTIANSCEMGIYTITFGSVSVRNNIICAATQYGVRAYYAEPMAEYNCTFANGTDYNFEPGIGNLFEAPRFVDTSNGDFHLLYDSPCINAADPNPAFNDPDGTPGDIGAIPFLDTLPLPAKLNYGAQSLDFIVYTLEPEIFWSFYDTLPAINMRYEIEVGIDTDWAAAEMWETGPVDSADTSVVYAGSPLENLSEYWIRVRVDGGRGWGTWLSRRLYTTIGHTLIVPPDIMSIQEVIEVAQPGDTVLVLPGIYEDNINFMGKGIVLTSTSASAPAVIEPADVLQPIVSFVSGEDSTSVMDGIWLRNTVNQRGVYCSESSPVIQNCRISGCHYVLDGAGVFLENSSAKLIDNHIFDNYASKSGGGVGVIGNTGDIPEIRGNTFYDNHAGHGAAIGCPGLRGGGVIEYNVFFDNLASDGGNGTVYIVGSGVLVVNNTVSDNNSGVNIVDGSECDLRNNIVVNNLGVGVIPAGATFDYNDVWNNGWANDGGVHGTSLDPEFYSSSLRDYRLRPNSPCIDAGDPDDQYNDPDGSRNDMGALCFELACGDVDRSSFVNISDAVFIIDFIFNNGPSPDPLEAADVDLNGVADITDAVYLIQYIFSGGPPPCEP